jgi:hypothetical protein
MRTFLRNNGLSLALLLLFCVSFVGQSIAGYRQYNQTQEEHGKATVSYRDYLRSGEFLEATFENWESEFLQMAVYVWLTSFLYQRGSAESRDPDKKEMSDEDPELHRHDPKAPLPVRRGGFLLRLYQHSLLLALLLLFIATFGLHLMGSTEESCREAAMHGQPCPNMPEQLASARFWFESFQNWQSEFLSIAALVLLSIFLRQKGSPESKQVYAAHSATGKD